MQALNADRPHDYRPDPRREGMADGGPCYFLGCRRESYDPIHLSRFGRTANAAEGGTLDVKRLMRAWHEHRRKMVVSHPDADDCWPENCADDIAREYAAADIP